MDYSEQQKQLINKITQDIERKDFYISTIVEMQKDYENDDAICLSSVVFLDEDIRNKITKEIIEPLRQIDPKHYYYPSDTLHVTIKNVRVIHKPPLFTAEDIKKGRKVFNQIIPFFRPFSFELRGLVRFPTSISLIGYSDETLYKLVSSLDKGLTEVGVPDDKKYASDKVFFGNTTICRFNSMPTKRFLAKVEEMKNIAMGKFNVKEISLVTCNAVCSSKSRQIIEKFILK